MAEIPVPDGYGIPLVDLDSKLLPAGTMTQLDARYAPSPLMPLIPSDANLNDYTTPGVYQLVDPDNLGAVAHDTTIVDPLWNGTIWGVWATLTVMTGNPGLYGDVFQVIAKDEGGGNGVEYLERQAYFPLAGQSFFKIAPFTPAPRELPSGNAALSITPETSNLGDVWYIRNRAQTVTFQKFTQFKKQTLDVSFVTDVYKITFAAAAGITLVVPAGKKASCTKGVVRATGVAVLGSANGTVFLSGDLDAA
jgi:hypothetical protein